MAGKGNKPGVFVYFVTGADSYGLKINNILRSNIPRRVLYERPCRNSKVVTDFCH
jgi:hypothetical protein